MLHRFIDVGIFAAGEKRPTAVVQRVKHGAKVAAEFSADSPPTGDYPPEFYKGKFFGRGFGIEATFDPDRVDQGDGKYLTGEYRQFVRGFFKADGQIIEHKLADGKTLHKTKYQEDGHVSAGKYGYRTKVDHHGKYTDLGEGGSSYAGTDIPSLPVAKDERVEMDLEFLGRLVVTNEKSEPTGEVLAGREWNIKGKCARNRKGDVIQARAVSAMRAPDRGPGLSLEGARVGTELPGRIRKSAEAISGFSLDGVSVHYDSAQPARLGARALTAGKQIHIAPGEQIHLPHETWHVIQQMQGRVRPTRRLAAVDVNDDPALEREADSMGARLSSGPAGRSLPSLFRSAIDAPNLAQLKKIAELPEAVIRNTDDLKSLAAGYYASQQSVELESAWSGDTILGTKLSKNYLTDDEWQALDIPDQLWALIAKFPRFYVPTTPKIWKDLFARIDKSQGKLVPTPERDVALALVESDRGIEEARKGILEGVAKKSGGPPKGVLNERERKLYNQIMEADMTFNFPLDRLFLYKAPRLLNAFEVAEKTRRRENNIAGSLETERMGAEKKHFDIPEDARINPRIRPRYAAVNFKGHPTGAAARNDYGLSYMVLSKDLRPWCTITPGDTFDVDSVYPYTPDGVANMVKTLLGSGYADPSVTEDSEYRSGDFYFDAQIHKDVDFRTDVERIMISTLEMELFGVSIQSLDEAIENLTGRTFRRI